MGILLNKMKYDIDLIKTIVSYNIDNVDFKDNVYINVEKNKEKLKEFKSHNRGSFFIAKFADSKFTALQRVKNLEKCVQNLPEERKSISLLWDVLKM